METCMLEGSQFRLRPWLHEDRDSLVRHANNKKIAMNLRDGFPHPYTMDDAREWIEMALDNKRDVILAIEIDREACGGIGLHLMKDVYRFNAEIGYWLSEKHWGKGITTEAVRLLVDYAFRNTSLIRIFAGVFSSNYSSMRVLEKCGFKREAVFKKSVKKEGAFLDEHIYSVLKDDWKINN